MEASRAGALRHGLSGRGRSLTQVPAQCQAPQEMTDGSLGNPGRRKAAGSTGSLGRPRPGVVVWCSTKLLLHRAAPPSPASTSAVPAAGHKAGAGLTCTTRGPKIHVFHGGQGIWGVSGRERVRGRCKRPDLLPWLEPSLARHLPHKSRPYLWLMSAFS